MEERLVILLIDELTGTRVYHCERTVNSYMEDESITYLHSKHYP